MRYNNIIRCVIRYNNIILIDENTANSAINKNINLLFHVWICKLHYDDTPI